MPGDGSPLTQTHTVVAALTPPQPVDPVPYQKRLTVADRLRKLGERFAKDKDHSSTSALSVSETSSHNKPANTPPFHPGEVEPEPTSLAREIQDLVDSLPLPTPGPLSPILQASPLPPPTQNFPLSPYTPSIPLPPSTDDPQPQIKDSRLIALLSNASFMNGSSLKGKPSIWSVLQNIHRTSSPKPHPNSTTTSPTHVDSEIQPLKDDESPPPASSSNIYPNQLSNESSPSMIISDTSSIMVYSPLFPTQSDFVELAELVPFDSESGELEEQVNSDGDADVGPRSEPDVDGASNTQEFVAGGTSWTLMWPFSIWYRPNQTQQGISQILSSSTASAGAVEQRSLGFTTSPQAGTNNIVETSSPPTHRIRTVKSQRSIRAWVPSPSKISVQAFWWGYRLYLPPPILEVLSDKTLEAAKRSAVITTALTWFFNNLPIEVFPPPMKPGLVLLQRLVPVLGYIGTFISWSWSTIRGYDVGYGVTLTATWILPVALIPGTWHERDFPKSPVPNSPIPLPPSHPFSIQSFEPPTPTMSTTTAMTDDDIPTSAYATPMSSVMLSPPHVPVPGGVLDRETGVLDPSLASSSTAWSPSPLPSPPHLPISPPTHYPSTTLPNSPNSLYFPPNSPTATPIITHHSVQLQPSVPTSPLPLIVNSSTTLPSPRIRRPRFSTRMGSSSPSISSNNGNSAISPHLTTYNTVPPTQIPTPIPMPRTPIDLPPIPPELPFSPKLVNQLLRGPVLQTVPLPDVDDTDGDGGVRGVGVGVGVGLDKGPGIGVVDRTRGKKKSSKMESNNPRGVKTSMSFSPSRRKD